MKKRINDMHYKKMNIWVGIFGLCMLFNLNAGEPSDFVVIVHKSNPIKALDKNKLSEIFLKKVQVWENNEMILPIELKEDAPVRITFSTKIHEKKVSKIKAYWQKQIFSGRGIPPPEKANDLEILKYIEENPNAIGYVSTKTNIADFPVVAISIE